MGPNFGTQCTNCIVKERRTPRINDNQKASRTWGLVFGQEFWKEMKHYRTVLQPQDVSWETTKIRNFGIPTARGQSD